MFSLSSSKKMTRWSFAQMDFRAISAMKPSSTLLSKLGHRRASIISLSKPMRMVVPIILPRLLCVSWTLAGNLRPCAVPLLWVAARRVKIQQCWEHCLLALLLLCWLVIEVGRCPAFPCVFPAAHFLHLTVSPLRNPLLKQVEAVAVYFIPRWLYLYCWLSLLLAQGLTIFFIRQMAQVLINRYRIHRR